MAYRFGATVYDDTHPWMNTKDRVDYQRAFAEGTFEQRLRAAALLTASPATPNIEITVNLTTTNYGQQEVDDTPLTIGDILGHDLDDDGHLHDMHTTEFTGKISGRDGTDVPSLPLW